MKLTNAKLRLLIKEELDNIISYEDPADVEPVEDAWAGGEDLVLPIDHAEAGGGEPVTSAPEVLEITEAIMKKVLWRLGHRG